mgnify:CR=1 FL=1
MCYGFVTVRRVAVSAAVVVLLVSAAAASMADCHDDVTPAGAAPAALRAALPGGDGGAILTSDPRCPWLLIARGRSPVAALPAASRAACPDARAQASHDFLAADPRGQADSSLIALHCRLTI